MTLRFDENCLRPPNLASSANLLIVAWEDGQRLTFTVRRALLVRHLPAAERAELSPTLDRWAHVIQRACIYAAGRVEAYKAADLVEVAIEDFRGERA